MAIRGRPTDYRPEYCEKVIEWLATGKSVRSFAGNIEVVESTIYEWMHNFPDFSKAVKIGRLKQAAYYESVGIDMIHGRLGRQANLGAFVWMTKNMLGWSDKAEVKSVGVEATSDTRALTDSQLSTRLRELADKAIGAIDARTNAPKVIEATASVPKSNDSGTDES